MPLHKEIPQKLPILWFKAVTKYYIETMWLLAQHQQSHL